MTCTSYTISIFVLSLIFHTTYTTDFVAPKHELLHRNKRQLLFLNQTFLQFTAGISSPTAHKQVKVNYAIQAQFTLPWNTSQIPTDGDAGFVSTARGKRDTNTPPTKTRDYENDASLFHFYKYIEEVLDGYGYNGAACILQALCQLAADPLHTDVEEDLFHELTSFLFTPTNDIQDGFTPRHAHIYIHAHKQGMAGEDCKDLYHCGFSLVDLFSFKRHDRNNK